MQKSIGLEIAAKSAIYSAQTSATGTNWVQLGDHACQQVIVYNNTGTALEVSYCLAADGSALSGQASLAVADGVAQILRGISNATQVRVRRVDVSNTQVTFSYVIEGVAAV